MIFTDLLCWQEFAHLIRNKFGSADNISSLTSKVRVYIKIRGEFSQIKMFSRVIKIQDIQLEIEHKNMCLYNTYYS